MRKCGRENFGGKGESLRDEWKKISGPPGLGREWRLRPCLKTRRAAAGRKCPVCFVVAPQRLFRLSRFVATPRIRGISDPPQSRRVFRQGPEGLRQEDALALIDDSLNMFAGRLCGDSEEDPTGLGPGGTGVTGTRAPRSSLRGPQFTACLPPRCTRGHSRRTCPPARHTWINPPASRRPWPS